MGMEQSRSLYESARQVIPGGVNSPVRACGSVGCDPRFMVSGRGAKVTDADGNEFLDYIGSWGPVILGHAHPAVIEAVVTAAGKGLSFGAPAPAETVMAEAIVRAIPSVEMVRMVNSGTEATMSAIRLARGATGRDRIVKFDGCYHGHADSLLVAAGSGVATLGIPGSPGVPKPIAELTMSLPYNDAKAVKTLMESRGGEVAAIILEPVGGNMGVVPPEPGFLELLRDLCNQTGALLIFDEVMTGFRVAPGGAQERYNITPDLTTLGKIIGGGMPVGAYGGRREIMERIAPAGDVYQAGTLSGNPVAMAAGIATLTELLKDPAELYGGLENVSRALEEGLLKAAKDAGETVHVNRVGSMVTLFFQEGPVRNFEEAKKSDTARFGAFYRAMLEAGVSLPPSQFEAWFVSAAHTMEDAEDTVRAAERAFSAL